jgi:DNA-directed RNA polymerase specialized sigma24 family protein
VSTEQDFIDFVDARWASLYRLAYLLTASPAAAEDLLQTALEKAYLNWSRIRQMEYPEAYVRRMLATTLASSCRRRGCPRPPRSPASRSSSTGRCCGR